MLARKTCGFIVAESTEVVGPVIWGVVQRPVLLVVGVRVGAVRPAPAVCRHLAIGIEVVERRESLRERMDVGCHALAEYRKRRVSVALAEVAKDFVISAVLLHDIDQVRDRGGGA